MQRENLLVKRNARAEIITTKQPGLGAPNGDYLSIDNLKDHQSKSLKAVNRSKQPSSSKSASRVETRKIQVADPDTGAAGDGQNIRSAKPERLIKKETERPVKSWKTPYLDGARKSLDYYKLINPVTLEREQLTASQEEWLLKKMFVRQKDELTHVQAELRKQYQTPRESMNRFEMTKEQQEWAQKRLEIVQKQQKQQENVNKEDDMHAVGDGQNVHVHSAKPDRKIKHNEAERPLKSKTPYLDVARKSLDYYKLINPVTLEREEVTASQQDWVLKKMFVRQKDELTRVQAELRRQYKTQTDPITRDEMTKEQTESAQKRLAILQKQQKEELSKKDDIAARFESVKSEREKAISDEVKRLEVEKRATIEKEKERRRNAILKKREERAASKSSAGDSQKNTRKAQSSERHCNISKRWRI